MRLPLFAAMILKTMVMNASSAPIQLTRKS